MKNENLAGGPETSFDLRDRVALVTGGRQGIGRTIAVALARAGARLAISSRHIREVDGLIRELKDAGLDAMGVELDVTRPEDIARAFELVEKSYGRLDILINNAGLINNVPSMELSQTQWDAVLDVNLKGAFFCCQSAARLMAASGGGRIISLSSTYGRAVGPGYLPYAVSKAGLEHMTRTLAVEWAPLKITVNAIAPTTVLTASRAAMLSDQASRQKRIAMIPMGRFCEPADLVGAVLLLATGAGAFITGQTIVVDGGYTLL